ncbi:hypothetical protein LTR85_004221 [Meristemomyces frigidus]|nr:hypothetical protein LTR85_004221 [Meristemomyces frigidus]
MLAPAMYWIQKCLWPKTPSRVASQQGAPRILATIETSSSTLSKSGGKGTLTITLKATIEGKEPVTINAFQTILDPRMPAQGLTFKDTQSGNLAERVRIDIHYEVPDLLSITTDSVVEIPTSSQAAGQPAYTVSHTFKVLDVRQPKSGDPPLSFEEQLQLEISPVAGFAVGHTYEIGLGEDMSKISWWRVGQKSDVFAGGRQLRALRDNDLPNIRMVAMNTPRFTVVE